MSGDVEHWEPQVVEAGSGAILIRRTDVESGASLDIWLHAGQIAGAMEGVVRLALSDDDSSSGGIVPALGVVGRQEARTLLSPLIQAAVMASTTGDKYEAMMLTGEDDPPCDPFCHRCGATAAAVEHELGRPEGCEAQGHQAFGAKEGETWEGGLERHRRDRKRWEFRTQMGLIPPMPPLAR